MIQVSGSLPPTRRPSIEFPDTVTSFLLLRRVVMASWFLADPRRPAFKSPCVHPDSVTSLAVQHLPTHYKDLNPKGILPLSEREGYLLSQLEQGKDTHSLMTFARLRTAQSEQRPQSLTQPKIMFFSSEEWASTACLRTGTCVGGMARCLVSVMEIGRAFLFFLITLLCDRSHKVKEK